MTGLVMLLGCFNIGIITRDLVSMPPAMNRFRIHVDDDDNQLRPSGVKPHKALSKA